MAGCQPLCHPFGCSRTYDLRPMAISFSRPDPSSPTAVSTANFSSARRGYEPEEVREFLRMVAAELARLQERERFLERELRTSQRNAPSAGVALDEELVTRMLGEEAVRILSTAREAANQIKMRAEDGASRVLREATDEAQRLREEAEIESSRRRQDASSDAESELQMAKQQGREMVNEARAYRERVLGELARRREMARQQIEQLVHGRDRLLNAFERARLAAVDVMAEMTPLGEPTEYVNLSPITGPVPLMVPTTEARPRLVVADLEVPDLEPEAELVPEVVEPSATELSDTELSDTETSDTEQAVAEIEALEEIESSEQIDESGEGDDDEPMTNVVSLFEEPASVAAEADDTTIDSDDEDVEAKASVEDLFARLRAARADKVALAAVTELVAEPEAIEPETAESQTAESEATEPETTEPETTESETAEPTIDGPTIDEPELAALLDVDVTEELSVFQASPAAPTPVIEADDSPFGRRDAELTPLIVAAARKLKRVLADEQNDLLHILRRAEPVRAFAALLPSPAEHAHRYAAAIEVELRLAALAGAASVDDGDKGDHLHEITRAKALQPAIEALAATVIDPLRVRVARAVTDSDGDNGELADLVRALYREWKTQRIDEHLDDVTRMAFGRGALVALAPGAPVCWSVDPNGPACPDAEDNALAGAIAAGQPFPTDHVCAPAHEGCRCMLQRAPL